MARKKSRLSALAWLLFTGLTGGGVSGYLKPDLPIVGRIVEKVVARLGSPEPSQLTATLQDGGYLPDTAGGLLATPRNTQTTAQFASARVPTNSLLISSFNIQVLGKSKMSKPGMPQALASIIRNFDVVAIQEVRAKDDDILPELVSAINADGSQYRFVIGPRLGRTASTEQYAFVFNASTVEHDPSSVGTINDPSDVLHREPLVTRFRARTQSPAQAFTFWLVNVHTDPDEVAQEVDALADVFHVMRSALPDEDDVILLGDFNASETQLGRLGQYPGIRWAVNGVMTNTRQTKAYDNIVFHGQATSEYTGRWGVVDLESALGISREAALTVSDHLPVWAEFQLWETPSQGSVAARPSDYRR